MGDLDNPEVYRKLQVERAAMVATTAGDAVNTHVAFTVRELAAEVPIIATADDPASVDILELAGCTFVLQIPEMLGQSLARRVSGSDARAHVIGRYGELLIAEATATGTDLVGKTLQEIGLHRELGLTAVGVWERGEFKTATARDDCRCEHGPGAGREPRTARELRRIAPRPTYLRGAHGDHRRGPRGQRSGPCPGGTGTRAAASWSRTRSWSASPRHSCWAMPPS